MRQTSVRLLCQILKEYNVKGITVDSFVYDDILSELAKNDKVDYKAKSIKIDGIRIRKAKPKYRRYMGHMKDITITLDVDASEFNNIIAKTADGIKKIATKIKRS